MCKRQLLIVLLAAAAFISASAFSSGQARADEGQGQDEGLDAAELLKGVWAINFVAPEISPKGNRFEQPHRHRFTFSDINGQRTTVAREVQNLRVPGVWRPSGEEFSATFEFTCGAGVTCGSIVLRGKLDSETRMSGRLIIFWDSPDSSTPTGLDTVRGTFTGEKCGSGNTSGIRILHDTGGCEGD
ncbi:MAG TPA: hypothetical protein VE262_10050 [Blastocatellia bacterium]|nr:hypothetical protein [Blastocatellia bacterium]